MSPQPSAHSCCSSLTLWNSIHTLNRLRCPPTTPLRKWVTSCLKAFLMVAVVIQYFGSPVASGQTINELFRHHQFHTDHLNWPLRAGRRDNAMPQAKVTDFNSHNAKLSKTLPTGGRHSIRNRLNPRIDHNRIRPQHPRYRSTEVPHQLKFPDFSRSHPLRDFNQRPEESSDSGRPLCVVYVHSLWRIACFDFCSKCYIYIRQYVSISCYLQ